MEKISGILPSSSRIKSVDLTDSPPARPGAPANGRKVGRNSVADRITLSERAKEMAAQDTMMVKNPKETSRAKMVEEINRNFFETRLKPVYSEPPKSEQVEDAVEEAATEFAPLRAEALAQYESPEVLSSRFSVEA
jgi:hypothetical protein